MSLPKSFPSFGWILNNYTKAVGARVLSNTSGDDHTVGNRKNKHKKIK